ncbi:hypothetical protein B0H17DRAFT_1130132 [Mycena rosella]|uniref:Uncharacterized protein n=1 Tax=Mycena rosella TaxID=1033263 RepID=A0AAD7GNV2_MYCRO|nr:hypothetical protein B0H17DRAFT_1130132 [Mycena rosella]
MVFDPKFPRCFAGQPGEAPRDHLTTATWVMMMAALVGNPLDLARLMPSSYFDADTIPSALDNPPMHIHFSDLIACGVTLDMKVIHADLRRPAIHMTGEYCNIMSQEQSGVGIIARYTCKPDHVHHLQTCLRSELHTLVTVAKGYLRVGDAGAHMTDWGYNSVDALFAIHLAQVPPTQEWCQMAVMDTFRPRCEGNGDIQWSGNWNDPATTRVGFLLTHCGNSAVANSFPHSLLSEWPTPDRIVAGQSACNAVNQGIGFIEAPHNFCSLLHSHDVVMNAYKLANNWGAEFGGIRGWSMSTLAEFVKKASECWIVDSQVNQVPVLPTLRRLLEQGEFSPEWGRKYSAKMITFDQEAKGWVPRAETMCWIQIMLLDTWIAAKMGNVRSDQIPVPRIAGLSRGLPLGQVFVPPPELRPNCSAISILALLAREVAYEEQCMPVAAKRAADEAGDEAAYHGDFVTHPECAARVEGSRQTFSLHVSGPADPNFDPLPTQPAPNNPATKKKTITNSPATNPGSPDSNPNSELCTMPNLDLLNVPPAHLINRLKICGHIKAKARGKELIVTISNRETRKHLSSSYFVSILALKAIASGFPQPGACPEGEKSKAFVVPAEYNDGPAEHLLLSIQAAFIRPKWTLIFVDHNVFITFHLMQASKIFVPQDLEPGSAIWPALWSRSHGPVYNQEPEAALQALDAWRSEVLSNLKPRCTSIFAAMKAHQTVFNGSGAQEATDQLLLAFIHPQMSALDVCRDNEAKLPLVSGERPFRMNNDGHTKYLSSVYSYWRKIVVLDANFLQTAHKVGLFIPNAIIQVNGHAIVPPDLPKLDSSSRDLQSRELVTADVKQDAKKTTLGLYSFRIFVDCVWSAQKVSKGTVPLGRRAKVTVGHSNCKRPLKETIEQTGVCKRQRISVDQKENYRESFTRSGKKIR